MCQLLSHFRIQRDCNIANKWYQSQDLHRLLVEMPKRGGSSIQDLNTAIQEIMPKIEAMKTWIFLLTSTKYRLWAMRVEVYLEAQGLWEVITETETNQKKDRQALSVILNSVSEFVSFQLDVKKTMKENWEIIWILHVGVDHVVQ